MSDRKTAEAAAREYLEKWPPVLIDDVLKVDIAYPRDGSVQAVEVDLMDVRSADSLHVSYDFDRNGWVVKQATRFVWGPGEEKPDPKWKEVAFIQAWGSREDDDE